MSKLIIPGDATINFKGDHIEVVDINPGDVSDGYHTFSELYDHRCLLFIALANVYSSFAWKSKKHADGSDVFDGWFVAGLILFQSDNSYKEITYHLPNKYWDLLDVKTVDQPSHFDGHTSKDVLDRLKSYNVAYIKGV